MNCARKSSQSYNLDDSTQHLLQHIQNHLMKIKFYMGIYEAINISGLLEALKLFKIKQLFKEMGFSDEKDCDE